MDRGRVSGVTCASQSGVAGTVSRCVLRSLSLSWLLYGRDRTAALVPWYIVKTYPRGAAVLGSRLSALTESLSVVSALTHDSGEFTHPTNYLPNILPNMLYTSWRGPGRLSALRRVTFTTSKH